MKTRFSTPGRWEYVIVSFVEGTLDLLEVNISFVIVFLLGLSARFGGEVYVVVLFL